ncbi:MAG: MBL fold metallo-hydrolase [Clostridia bacterium]|nr:MBL fold metallo-hydrolase [Clostridia bacterium]
MRLCSLYSGSSGNCIFVENGQTRLLVDCGVSGKKIEQALSSHGIDLKSINAVLVTHEHSDHVQSVGIIHRKSGADIYANEGTFRAFESSIGRYNEASVKIFDGKFNIGDIEITPFSIPHDAADPVGYTFSDGIKKLSVCTDIGYVTDELSKNVMGSDVILLEANHDVEMLKSGPYPYPLKKRILSDKGHLSNEKAGVLCRELIKHGSKDIILGHLSMHNNHPDLAYVTVKSVLEEGGIKVSDCRLSVASREFPGEIHVC